MNQREATSKWPASFISAAHLLSPRLAYALQQETVCGEEGFLGLHRIRFLLSDSSLLCFTVSPGWRAVECNKSRCVYILCLYLHFGDYI